VQDPYNAWWDLMLYYLNVFGDGLVLLLSLFWTFWQWYCITAFFLLDFFGNGLVIVLSFFWKDRE
jgi:hypothetical protein